MRIKTLIVALLAAGPGQSLFAQTTNLGYGTTKPERGFLPTGAYSISDTESISDTTGNVNLRMPLGSLPAGRAGQSFQLNLTYNSRVFNLRSQIETGNTVVSDYPGQPVTVNRLVPEGDSGGWKYNFSAYLEIDTRPIACSSSPWAHSLRFVGTDGDSHALRMSATFSFWNDSDSPGFFSRYAPTGERACPITDLDPATTQLPANIGPVITYFTTDGSYIRVQVLMNSGIWRAVYPDGRYVQGPVLGGALKGADRFCDRNANCIAVTNTLVAGNDPVTEIEDDWHRKLTITYTSSLYNPTPPTPPQPCTSIPCANSEIDEIRSLGYPAVAVAAATDPRSTTANLTKVTWTNVRYGEKAGELPILYRCRVPGAAIEYTCKLAGGHRVVDTITLPNAALRYKFEYADDNAPQRGWGQLRRVFLPVNDVNKPTVDYAYTRHAPISVNDPDVSLPWDKVLEDPITQKTLTYYEQTDAGLASAATTLSWGYVIGASSTAVTNPDGGVTTSLFYNRTLVPSAWNAGLVYQITDPSGAQIQRFWAQNEPWIGINAPNDPKNPYVRAEYRRLGDGSTRIGASATELDKNGNVTMRSDFDWVGASSTTALPSGTTLRKTQNTYAAASGAAPVAPVQSDANAYWNAGSPQTRSVLKETRVFAGNNTVENTKKLTQFVYDNELLTANLIQEWQWKGGPIPALATALTTGNAIVKYRTWDQGNLLSETDPNSVATTYEYATLPNCPANYSRLYPSKVVAAGTERRFEYHCATGLVTKEIAVSNRNLETTMDYDVYGRLIAQAQAANVVTHKLQKSVTYDDLNRLVRTVTDFAPGSQVASVQHFDQLGRLFLQRESDEVKGSPLAATTDQGGVKSLSLQRMVGGDGRYELSSNPYREPLASETSPTMGWSWKRFDRAGRLIETREYAGAAKPSPWGVNPNQLGSSVNTTRVTPSP